MPSTAASGRMGGTSMNSTLRRTVLSAVVIATIGAALVYGDRLQAWVAGGEGLIQFGLIALGLLAAVAFLQRLIGRLREGPMLEVEELKRRLDGGEELLLMDVRTREDFVGEQSHLPVARNLPLEELADRLDELGGDHQQTIAIICRTDRRSAKAAALLARRGFADVHVVRGGMTAWLDRNWPTARVQEQGGAHDKRTADTE